MVLMCYSFRVFGLFMAGFPALVFMQKTTTCCFIESTGFLFLEGFEKG